MNIYTDRYAFGDIGRNNCPNDYHSITNTTQCEIAAISLGFSYLKKDEHDLWHGVCKFCGSCIPQTVRIESALFKETVYLCQWKYHGSYAIMI